ncbi:MAG TPA: hypothetical protein VGM94_04375 [Galbitalea sp.]
MDITASATCLAEALWHRKVSIRRIACSCAGDRVSRFLQEDENGRAMNAYWHEDTSRLASAGQDDPAPGDLWTVSWNAQIYGVVLVGQVHEDHSTVYPVLPSLGVQDRSLLRVRVDDSVDVDCWIGAGFGMGNFMFESLALSPLDGHLVQDAIRRYHSEDDEPRGDQATLRNGAERAVSLAQKAGRVEWPRAVVGEAVLDSAVLIDCGLDMRAFRDLLGVTPGAASKLWSGQFLIDEAQAAVISERIQVLPDVFLIPFFGPEELEMVRPRTKWSIRIVSQRYGEDEPSTRSRALRAALRSGRAPAGGDDRARARASVDNALQELIRDPV